MRSIIDKWGVKKGFKLSSKNIGISDNVISIPLYMAIFL